MHTTTGGLTEFETREDEKEYELQRAEPGHRMLTTKQIDTPIDPTRIVWDKAPAP